jgi:hypothetical protein
LYQFNTDGIKIHGMRNKAASPVFILHFLTTITLLVSFNGISIGNFNKSYSHPDVLQKAKALSVGGCEIFPSNNFWNTPVDDLPVHSLSSAWVDSIGRTRGFHMDFGSGIWDGGTIGIPYNIVSSSTPRYNFDFYYPNESDDGPYPIPSNPAIEHGSDQHIISIDTTDCTLYEIYDASQQGGQWSGGSGAIWDLDSNQLRPNGWTSADAAGLPIFPGLARYDEIVAGEITHALRFTTNCTADYYIWPARHVAEAGSCSTPVPFGARFRLKSGYNINGFSPQAKIVLQAMKTYGIVLADNGSPWYVTGAPNENWDNEVLHEIDVVTGNDFEAVDTSGWIINVNSGQAYNGITISGNAGTNGVVLSYVDAGTKTVTSLADGSYSLDVPVEWSGTVTPSHTCFNFTPANRTYSNLAINQTTQNYTPVFNAASGCANINVNIGGVSRGTYGLPPQAGFRVNYTGLDSGPVKVISSNAVPIIAAIREAWQVSGVTTSFSQLMGLPLSQVSDTYVFPAYNNVTLDEQLRIGNVDTVASTVTVTIGGVLRGTYDLDPNEAVRINYAGLDSGPVIVKGTTGVDIISAIREAWKVNGSTRSFVQLMGLPSSQLSDKYVFPAYNNVTLNEQLRIGNVDTVPSTVIVTIGGVQRGTYDLDPNEAVRINYAGLDSGPVIVDGTNGVDIISSIRDAWQVNGTTTSFSQLMGMPAGGLSDTYIFPAYNNVTLDEQLRIGNVDTVPTTVIVTIGGVLRGTYDLDPSEAVRINYAGLDSGPVVVAGTDGVDIISAIREAWKVNGVTRSFVQLMGLPLEQLSTTYLFPAYNNVTLNEQLRFAVP